MPTIALMMPAAAIATRTMTTRSATRVSRSVGSMPVSMRTKRAAPKKPPSSRPIVSGLPAGNGVLRAASVTRARTTSVLGSWVTPMTYPYRPSGAPCTDSRAKGTCWAAMNESAIASQPMVARRLIRQSYISTTALASTEICTRSRLMLPATDTRSAALCCSASTSKKGCSRTAASSTEPRQVQAPALGSAHLCVRTRVPGPPARTPAASRATC